MGGASFVDLEEVCPAAGGGIAQQQRAKWTVTNSLGTIVELPAPGIVTGPGCAFLSANTLRDYSLRLYGHLTAN